MTIATGKNTLKRRLDEYLWWDDDLANRRLRLVIEHHFGRFENVAIVGGMVRDFARVGKTGFSSDVDLVIDAPADRVADMAKAASARVNAFGGYSISEQGWNVDFWALETTWAIREGHVRADHLEDFTRSTFFNYDAVMYDIRRRQVLCDGGYLDRLRGGELDINLLPNPTVVGNLYRAIRRVLLWDLSAGPMLQAFITDHLDHGAFKDVVGVDQRKSASPFLHKYKSPAELRSAVISKEYRRAMATYYGTQLSLPGIGGEIECHSVPASGSPPVDATKSCRSLRYVPRSSLMKRSQSTHRRNRVLEPLL